MVIYLVLGNWRIPWSFRVYRGKGTASPSQLAAKLLNNLPSILTKSFQIYVLAVLVTELTRWGRTTLDLIHTLQDLAHWQVSLIATTGIQFDLDTPQGKLIAGIMATLAEFERDLVRERVRSGLAAAKAKGKKLGRRPGQRVKSDSLAPKVLQMVAQGYSYRQIARELNLSKTTVNEIVKRERHRNS